MQPTEERWLPVVGYEGFYEVSDLGRVRGLDRYVSNATAVRFIPGRISPLHLNRVTGYLATNLSRDGKRASKAVHVLVVTAFVGPRPLGAVVRHLNGTSTDNRLVNLRWGTPTENCIDQVNHGTNRQANRTACEREGHPFDEDNTVVRWAKGRRQRACRECMREASRRYRQRQKTAAASAASGV